MDPSRSIPSRLGSALQQAGVDGGRALVAVSGGPDSVALLRGLVACRDAGGPELIVAHVNHRFRGAAADADAAFVQTLAARHGLTCALHVAEREPGPVREAAARELRYRVLTDFARTHAAGWVLTGHTRDDQVETVWHHLLRGTGLAGLRGIPTRRALGGTTLLRPLLEVTRAEVLAYLAALGQPYRVDATNAETTLTRNWLRHELLPRVRERYPRADEALARLARQAGEWELFLADEVGKLKARVVLRRTTEWVELSTADWEASSPVLLRALLVEVWTEQGWPRGEMSYDRWQELVDLTRSPRAAADFPGGIAARHERGCLTLRR